MSKHDPRYPFKLEETRIVTEADPVSSEAYCTDCHEFIAQGSHTELVRRETILHCKRTRHRVYIRVYRGTAYRGVPK